MLHHQMWPEGFGRLALLGSRGRWSSEMVQLVAGAAPRPVVKVTAEGIDRASMTVLICTEADDGDGSATASLRSRLRGLVVLVWDNVNTFVSGTMRMLIATR